MESMFPTKPSVLSIFQLSPTYFYYKDSDSFNSAAYYIFLKVGQSKINFSGGVL